MAGHTLDVVKDGVAYRLKVSEGTVHIGGGWLEVRPANGGSAINFLGTAVRNHQYIEECVEHLNDLMQRDNRFRGVTLTIEDLPKKEVRIA